MIISVEGIIGSGKTTFIKHLAKTLDACVKLEPVDEWKNSGILKNYYADFPKWAFPFQLQVITDKLTDDTYKNSSDKITIIERSVYSDKCFMEMFYTNKKITKIEYDLYNKIWNSLEKTSTIVPDIIIYLQPPLDECMKRVKQRSRSEEKDITREYQSDLLDIHDRYFDNTHLEINNKSIPIVKFTNKKNITTDKQYEEQVINSINQIYDLDYF